MSVAAIAIDNFLDTSKWNTIQAGISEYLNAPFYSENRTSLHTDINSWIKEKLSTLGLWNNLWDDEIKLFWQGTANLSSASDPSKAYERYFKFLLLCGQRRTEVAQMRWRELDSDTWNIPAARSKNARIHTVPLTSQMKQIIAFRLHLSS